MIMPLWVELGGGLQEKVREVEAIGLSTLRFCGGPVGTVRVGGEWEELIILQSKHCNKILC